MALDVNVPCTGCSARIHFGIETCAGCGTPVPSASKRALEERLEASSDDYRTMKRRIQEGSLLLLGVGVLHILVALFIYGTTDSYDASLERALLVGTILNCWLGAGMLIAAWFLPKHPRGVTVLVLACWAFIQFLWAWVNPLGILNGLLFKVAMLFVLMRGYFAAREAQQTRERLLLESLGPARR